MRNGAEEGIRTPDPHLGKVMLYRAELLPHSKSGGKSKSRRALTSSAARRRPPGATRACTARRERLSLLSVNILVHKYGGSSVNGPERIRAVAQRIAAARATGHAMVVVVSAMGDSTDHLIALAHQVSPTPSRREMDMLLSTGERVSMALLAMALNDLGVQAISFTGSQSGILTDEAHAHARIVGVKPDRIRAALDAGQVVIVAGFQGVSPVTKEITTLGRGGSDTTAVALAAALGRVRCEIFTDVDGVFTADPRVVPDARLVARMGYRACSALAHLGGRVLHARCVDLAARERVPLAVRSSFRDTTGTEIVEDRVEAPRLKP